ncbi:tyrosine-type recombinase/integrase [Weissella tructae]|uniref:site-specific integrase n=1 Tax=Weissella tructae TaxID=887702 RepID=UPI003D89B8EF
MATIEKRGKTYTARISLKVDGKYKRKSKSGFKTKTAAKSWAIEQENLKNNGADVLGSQILFSDYYEQWYTLYKTNITTSSRRWYTYALTLIDRHMAPVTLEKLSRPIVQAFFNELGENYAYSTSVKMKMYIRGAVKNAMYDGLIQRDPTLDITLSGKDSKDGSLKHLEEKDLLNLLKHIADIPLQERNHSDQMILFGANAGVRYQEAAALTLQDIIQHTLKEDEYVSSEEESLLWAANIDKAYDQVTKTMTVTKTDTSERIIDIPEQLAIDLLKWAHELNKRPTDLLFSIDGVKPVSPVAVNKRLKKILTDIQSSKIITYHGLRHTHATYLISKGLDVQYISERLGHSSPLITMKTYAHLFHKKRILETQKAIKLFDDLL